MNNGKKLEGLVAFVERALLNEGFEVKSNSKVFNYEGTQIAEFDVKIRGKVGTTEFSWLIECRDRPGSGAAPGSWIEQLFGRRQRFGFNKVIAVSTTGFTTGAIEFAAKEGIELREVKSLSKEEFSKWLKVQRMQYRVCKTSLNKASLYIAKDSEPEKLAALNKVLSTVDKKNLFLVSSKNGEKVLPENAFLAVVKTQNDLFDSVEVNGLARKVNIRAKYDNPEDHFIVNTNLGPLRILEILFQGELSIEETTIPVIGGIRCL